MSTREKELNSWEHANEAAWNTVESKLSYYGFIKLSKGSGSHMQYGHPILKQMIAKYPNWQSIKDKYGPGGQISVIRAGNKVKGYVLRRILDAIRDIEEYESFCN